MLKRFLRWLVVPRNRIFKITIVLLCAIGALYLAYFVISRLSFLTGPTGARFLVWAMGNETDRESMIVAQREACPGAPFILPADGFIGLPYASAGGPYSQANPHQGIDIFSPDRDVPGLVPVFAAHDGYITREEDWRSTLIQRVPNDPLSPGRQIWLYYTHMDDAAGNDFIIDLFPPGSRETFVEQGTLLGYTGNYNGNSPRTIWVHLHFSIVRDDGAGMYLNELEFKNTLDPSPYLGMPVNDACSNLTSGCGQVESCS